LVKEILENYGKNYDENDLEVTKGYMIKSTARAFETLRSKLNMLTNISNYGYADDYAKQREAIVKAMTVEDIKALAEKYLNPEKMIYLVVGDAATQMSKLEGLGFGKPELLNEIETEETIQQ
jgi:zinc protease